MSSITFHDIVGARRVVSRYLKPTPLIRYPELSDLLGFNAYINTRTISRQEVSRFEAG